MEGKIAWLIILSFGMLIQALIMALKIIREKSVKKNNPYGERMATLEEAVENLEKRMDRIEDKINKKYKSK
ncbi:hypothetical protein LCGC14_0489470 [marine sediment metagenome]|uniref:Phage shock protein B n=1 Tax=marine sediment metagenome TaxID=412755 RepID=A0A0F9VFU3_9ZZZZ